MATNKGPHTKLCSLDIPDLEALCRLIRESRGLDSAQIAAFCGIPKEQVTRLELQNMLGRESFMQYLNVLHSHPAVPVPLNQTQTAMLAKLYDERRKVQLHQGSLANMRFAYLTQKSRYDQNLAKLVAQLEHEHRPAFIMDGLWFIHALNGAQLRLFGIDPTAPLLQRWDGWHVVASKFRTDSPIRAVYVDPNEFIARTLVYFFEYEHTYPLLFTWQMRHLICRLMNLSQAHGFEFHNWWRQITSFMVPYNHQPVRMTMWYQEQQIHVTAMIAAHQKVQVERGQHVGYSLCVWCPVGTDAEQAFADIKSLPESQKLFYAAEYDVQHEFHVNDWPEVKAEMEK